MKNRFVFFISLILLVSYSCNDASNDDQKTYLCCGDNQFQSKNVDKLDQTAGKIYVFPAFTPNGDGFNDCFSVQNLDKYSHNSLTIYDLNDNIVFAEENYGSNPNCFFAENIKSGTLKYKLVVENEQTFVEYGYVCLVKTAADAKLFRVQTECTPDGFADPMLPN